MWAEERVGGREDSETLTGADREGQGLLEKSQETRALIGGGRGCSSWGFVILLLCPTSP